MVDALALVGQDLEGVTWTLGLTRDLLAVTA